MQYCRRCGAPLRAGARFCPACGNAAEVQIRPVRMPARYEKRKQIHPDAPEGLPSHTEAAAFLALGALLVAAVFIAIFFM
ncbi:MAG: zinc-ribbon domain-containing protein [Solobacterium sp.]|nr:zinc-ribbon domain-containing protein [Solobacterium sp.]